ncbi:pentapeptide repeat-containing protein [Nonomuraea sp. NPDC004297]
MAVLVLVAVPTLAWMLGPGATWVLENLDGVTLNDDVPPPATLPPNELTGKDWATAIAAVRGNVLAVATGMAALLAVFYTARNADTARRTFQLGERGHDTDRFSKAVEQLGSSQAPVRLGGLYALEQLAQTNPALRQTIVDVICAYLRMPWTPPGEEDRQQRIRAARTRSAGRTGARAGRDPDEERQVRLTAQRLLTGHLRWSEGRWWQRRTGANPLYWPGIRLDMTGAVLIDFDFEYCRLDRAFFQETVFVGSAHFTGSTFAEVGHFINATFDSKAYFDQATFTKGASFLWATFTNRATFLGTRFTQGAVFIRTTFYGDAWFSGATFSSVAYFSHATFRDALFDGATFAGSTKFDSAQGRRFDLSEGRVTHTEGAHVWPSGWRLETGPGGAVLRPDEQPDHGRGGGEQAGGEAAPVT